MTLEEFYDQSKIKSSDHRQYSSSWINWQPLLFFGDELCYVLSADGRKDTYSTVGEMEAQGSHCSSVFLSFCEEIRDSKLNYSLPLC